MDVTKVGFYVPILLSVLTVGCQSLNSTGMTAYEFDGCTCFPEGTRKQPDLWERHCYEHDYAYWRGGTREERKVADLKFREGIRGEGKPLIAQIAYRGVRMGGGPWLPTKWHWGFGWNEYPRRYRAISEEEMKQVKEFGPP